MRVERWKMMSKEGNKTCLKQDFVSVLHENIPFSYAEAFKSLRTNLEFVSGVNEARSILVTSAVPDESKSTVAVNLAITLSNSGKRVAVVECDLRKPTLRRNLDLGRGTNGLSSVLAGRASLTECIVYSETLGISFLLAGAVPPNPSELLNQPRMRELVSELKEQYDYVILDAPPVVSVTDATVVGRVVDGAILVIRSRFAPVKTIRQAKQSLEAVDVKILGGVLTRVSTKKSGWLSGYDYGYYG